MKHSNTAVIAKTIANVYSIGIQTEDEKENFQEVQLENDLPSDVEDNIHVHPEDEIEIHNVEVEVADEYIGSIFKENILPPLVSPLSILTEFNDNIEEESMIAEEESHDVLPEYSFNTNVPQIIITPPSPPTTNAELSETNDSKVLPPILEVSKSGLFEVTPINGDLFNNATENKRMKIKKGLNSKTKKITKLYRKNIYLKTALKKAKENGKLLKNNFLHNVQVPNPQSCPRVIPCCCIKLHKQQNFYDRELCSYDSICKGEFCTSYRGYFENNGAKSPDFLGFEEIREDPFHIPRAKILKKAEIYQHYIDDSIPERTSKNSIYLQNDSEDHLQEQKRSINDNVANNKNETETENASAVFKVFEKMIEYIDKKIDLCNNLNSTSRRTIVNGSSSELESETDRLNRKARRRYSRIQVSNSPITESAPCVKKRKCNRYGKNKRSAPKESVTISDANIEDKDDKNNSLIKFNHCLVKNASFECADTETSNKDSEIISILAETPETGATNYLKNRNCDLENNSEINMAITYFDEYSSANSTNAKSNICKEQVSIDSGYIKSDSDTSEATNISCFRNSLECNSIEKNCIQGSQRNEDNKKSVDDGCMNKKIHKLISTKNVRQSVSPSRKKIKPKSKLHALQNKILDIKMRRTGSTTSRLSSQELKKSVKQFKYKNITEFDTNCSAPTRKKKIIRHSDDEIKGVPCEIACGKSEYGITKAKTKNKTLTEILEKRKEALMVLRSSTQNLPKRNENPTKSSFKKPVCLKNVIPCPRSPSPEPILETTTSQHKIIPLEKPEPLSKKVAEEQLQKLLNFPNESAILEEVIAVFANQEESYIADIILEKLSTDIYDEPDKTYTPPAPLMTPTQRVLLGFMVALQKKSINVIDNFLIKAEPKLLLESRLLRISPILRVYLAICKFRHDRERMRRICCDAVYFMGDLAVPFFFMVITSWGDIIPMASESGDMPLANVLVKILMQKTCNRPGYNLINLKFLLTGYYGYQDIEDNCKLFENVFNKYKEFPNFSLLYAILLLCKHNSMQWSVKKMEKYIIPYVESIKHLEANTLGMLNLINWICRDFNGDGGSEYLTGILRWMDNFKNDTSENIRRKICLILDKFLKN